MLQLAELRVGNWLRFKGTYKAFRIRDGADLYNIVHYQTHEPIPLTPEMLSNAGFEISSDTVWSANNCEIELVQGNEGYYVVINREHKCGTPKLYLHELQNVSFALYGEELKINLY